MAFYGLFYARGLNAVLKALIVESVEGDVRACSGNLFVLHQRNHVASRAWIHRSTLKAYGAAVPFYVSAGIAGVSACALLAHRSPARNDL